MTILRVDSVKLDANPSKPFLALYFNHRIKIINSHRNPIVPQRNDLHFNCIHFDVTLLHTHSHFKWTTNSKGEKINQSWALCTGINIQMTMSFVFRRISQYSLRHLPLLRVRKIFGRLRCCWHSFHGLMYFGEKGGVSLCVTVFHHRRSQHQTA